MKRKSKVIAIIPARGGSKTIKYKNLALINGKPLVYYSIKSAIKSKLVDRVIVSTDNKRIKSVALKYGAEVPFLRPKNLSGDKVLDYPVINHVLKKLKLNTIKNKDTIIIYLRPTQPLRSSKDIDKVINFLIKKNNVDCVRSIRKAIYPPFWMKKLVDKKFLLPLINNKNFIKTARRQDLPDAYICDGYVDAIKIGSLIKHKQFPPKKCHAIMSNSKYFIDIDNKVDLDLANMILK